jgi:hypothetical protein
VLAQSVLGPQLDRPDVNFSYVYNLPRGSKLLGGSRTARWAADNWQISGITTFANGFPQNITLSTSDSFDFTGGATSRPA